MSANINSVSIEQLVNAANQEMLRLEYSRSTIATHSKELREFAEYCEENEIHFYRPDTGVLYFSYRYGLDVTDPTIKPDAKQRKTRNTLRFLDDIYQFGYARRYSHRDYNIPLKYAGLLDDYFGYCIKNNCAPSTIQVKRTKLVQFLCFLMGRGTPLSEVTASDISDYMITLCQYRRATIHIISSVLKDFFRYLYSSGIIETDLSGSVPRPRIYVEESLPETWTPGEIRQLLAAIDRNNAIGKRDYAMLLLAVILGMRAGDICALKFENLDWRQKLITYTQQKTGKVNTLPLLPIIGDAIIDYLKNGRLDSTCDNVFIRHIHPYGAFQSSSALSENLKRYMRQAGLTVKSRKVAHSLRHTLASCLLFEGTPLMTISNIMGHDSPKTTVGYTKVDLPALRKCALSYEARRELP